MGGCSDYARQSKTQLPRQPRLCRNHFLNKKQNLSKLLKKKSISLAKTNSANIISVYPEARFLFHTIPRTLQCCQTLRFGSWYFILIFCKVQYTNFSQATGSHAGRVSHFPRSRHVNAYIFFGNPAGRDQVGTNMTLILKAMLEDKRERERERERVCVCVCV